MKILSIETSCDETAIALIKGDKTTRQGSVLSHKLFSQASIHASYGGVFPSLAKREHAKNLIPLLKQVLSDTGLEKPNRQKIHSDVLENIRMDLERESELKGQFLEYIPTVARPNIDAIAITYGPGLEPALWVGINFAKALSSVWNIPVIPVNHMEGHIFAALVKKTEKKSGLEAQNSERHQDVRNGKKFRVEKIGFPAIALLISGGHTELVLVKENFSYELIGETKDDAVGEAFDKVARLMALPYPGGPEISKLAEEARSEKLPQEKWRFPRPMIQSTNFDFSFSGLKTAVRYAIEKKGPLTGEDKKMIAREFEDAVSDVLVEKTARAIEQYDVKTLIMSGGVSANTHIRSAFQNLASEKGDIAFYLSSKNLATDNAVMIGIAALMRHGSLQSDFPLRACGNVKLGQNANFTA